jgi:hypothetical protein
MTSQNSNQQKSDQPWWLLKKYHIGHLVKDDVGVRTISARQVGGQWEYAIVLWPDGVSNSGSASITKILRNGGIVAEFS